MSGPHFLFAISANPTSLAAIPNLRAEAENSAPFVRSSATQVEIALQLCPRYPGNTIIISAVRIPSLVRLRPSFARSFCFSPRSALTLLICVVARYLCSASKLSQ